MSGDERPLSGEVFRVEKAADYPIVIVTLKDQQPVPLSVIEGRRLAEDLTRAAGLDGWIPVSERLPELSREVLVGGPEGKEVTSRYERIGGGYGWVSSDGVTLNTDAFPVTHWMEIPPLPEAT